MNNISRRRSTPFILMQEVTNNVNGGHMKELQQLNEAEKEQLLYHLGKIYRKGTMQMMLGLHGMVEDCKESNADIEIAVKIRLILRQLNQEDARLLIQDYFEIGKSDWWMEQYTKETYLAKKSFAMNAFLRCLYD